MASTEDFVSSGSTQVNLACTGMSRCGYKKGDYVLCVGDSNTGKTYLALACLAEASINPAFDDYALIFDGPEGGAQMDIGECFGEALENRIQFLTPGNGASQSLEEMYDKTDSDIKNGPCIRVVDSMDALVAEDEFEQVKTNRKAREEGKAIKGSYNTAKPKINSQRLRVCAADAQKNGSILYFIAQTRDTFGFGAQFNPKTRGGGHAMKFYAQIEMWLSSKGQLTSDYKGKKVQIGLQAKVKVLRSRHTGKRREVEFPIYHSTGVDDIGGMVGFLKEWKHWKGTEKKVTAPEFDFSGSVEDLCQKIDEECKRAKLRKITSKVWKQIEEKVRVQRSNPYHKKEKEE